MTGDLRRPELTYVEDDPSGITLEDHQVTLESTGAWPLIADGHPVERYAGGVRAVCSCGWAGDPHPTPDGVYEGHVHLSRIWVSAYRFAGDGVWVERTEHQAALNLPGNMHPGRQSECQVPGCAEAATS
jgi:hypothetical protein